ncbi:ATP-binding protein [Plantibacter sp. YIM 135347]|uniref:ATP-binding protein n=1 Tax=Plantibacter sp. YIM 135347 TaxID=3423919 RepID=UPI003D3315C4
MTDSIAAPALIDVVEQWRVETMQLINWGGFDGYRSVDFSPSATLISGASGTGKSSLMDAYLAVMMSSDVPFNGASNDATGGRARSPEQRNLLTYLRGKVDSTRDPVTGALRDINLRGAEQITWGALAVTFANDDERRFTVLRAYLVPRRAQRTGDISMTMATIDDSFDLRRLEEFRAKRFDAGELQGRIPGLVVRDTYAELSYALYTRLGIGSGGDGSRAMRLLARIQAGQNLPTVDGLYKSMVLERPGTYDAADRAIAHFGALDEAYAAMETENRKARVLDRLPELHTEYVDAVESAQVLDVIGVTGDGDTPFTLWRSRRHESLLEDAVDANRRARADAAASVEAARAASKAGEVQLVQLEQQIAEQGGSALRRLEERIEGLETKRTETNDARSTLEDRLAPLDVPITSRADFDEARSASETFLERFDGARSVIDDARAALQREGYPLEQRNTELRQEKSSLAGRQGAVSHRLHDARLELAKAAGLSPEQLPFAAELMDVRPDEERWRSAIEVTLFQVARTLLVDENLLDDFGRSIDGVRIPTRLSFEGVRLGDREDVDADPDRVSGKVVFKDSPFSGWVQDRISSERVDAVCVDDASELGDGGRRVTPTGQIRDGRRGSHGETGAAPIIGFTNDARVASIELETADLARRLTELAERQRSVAAELTSLERERVAHRYLLDAEWTSIDVAAIDQELAEARGEYDRLLESSDILTDLRQQAAKAKSSLDAANKLRYVSEERLRVLEEEHGRLVDEQDAATHVIDRVERSGGVDLTEDQAARIEDALKTVGDAHDLVGFTETVKRLTAKLGDELATALHRAERARDALENMFDNYRSLWFDPNLGTGVESYADYRAILDAIIGTGLPERRKEWRRRLAQWSGEDLVPLSGAFDSAVEEIEDRLVPVNDILCDLPFGANHDRLKIVLRRGHREELAAFRRELKQLSGDTSGTLDDDALEARFERLRNFMDTIRLPEASDRPAASKRDQFLDVRRHVEITAVRYDTAGNDLSVYSSLGDKSGGETQELVAFIVGAALRYQLGDESRPRPRFAPVLLDEGFIKADSEFAGRAVAAWLRLGFQLVIGAPLDKVTALEPYMDTLLSMRKHPTTRHSYITDITRAVMEEPATNAAVTAVV